MGNKKRSVLELPLAGKMQTKKMKVTQKTDFQYRKTNRIFVSFSK